MKSGTPSLQSPGARSSLGVVGFLVVLELGSGIVSGYFSPLLRGIGETFQVTDASLNWVSAIFMLGTVVCVPILAKLGDVFGHKRLLVIAISMVALGSYVIAFAPNFEMFLLGRALQAPLAAFLPLEFAIVRERDPESSGKSIGLLVGALTIGAAVGSLASGLLYDALQDLGVVLLFPAVFITLCLPVILWLVPETSNRKTGRVDWVGAGFLTIGLLLLLTGISNSAAWGWANPKTLATIVIGVGLLFAWVFVERRVKDPMVNLTMLTKGGIGLPIVVAMLFGAQTYGSQTASFLWILSDPTIVGFGLGLPTGVAGIIIVLYALSVFLGTLLGDPLARQVAPPRAVAVSGAVGAASFLLMIVSSTSSVLFIAWLLIGGVSAGVILAVLPSIVVRNAPADSVGIASGLFNTARTAAGGIAGAVFVLIMSLFTTTVQGADGQSTVQSTPLSFFAVWGTCLAFCILLAAISLKFRTSDKITDITAKAETGNDATSG